MVPKGQGFVTFGAELESSGLYRVTLFVPGTLPAPGTAAQAPPPPSSSSSSSSSLSNTHLSESACRNRASSVVVVVRHNGERSDPSVRETVVAVDMTAAAVGAAGRAVELGEFWFWSRDRDVRDTTATATATTTGGAENAGGANRTSSWHQHGVIVDTSGSVGCVAVDEVAFELVLPVHSAVTNLHDKRLMATTQARTRTRAATQAAANVSISSHYSDAATAMASSSTSASLPTATTTTTTAMLACASSLALNTNRGVGVGSGSGSGSDSGSGSGSTPASGVNDYGPCIFAGGRGLVEESVEMACRPNHHSTAHVGTILDGPFLTTVPVFKKTVCEWVIEPTGFRGAGASIRSGADGGGDLVPGFREIYLRLVSMSDHGCPHPDCPYLEVSDAVYGTVVARWAGCGGFAWIRPEQKNRYWL
jgi:hypothetical protein